MQMNFDRFHGPCLADEMMLCLNCQQFRITNEQGYCGECENNMPVNEQENENDYEQ
jgi:hypothetical protein